MPVNPKSLQNLRQNRPKVERADSRAPDIRPDPVPISESTDIASVARPFVGEALEVLVKVMRGKTLPRKIGSPPRPESWRSRRVAGKGSASSQAAPSKCASDR